MFRVNRTIILGVVLLTLGALAEGQSATPPPCPGFNPANNTNIACELATGFPTTQSFSATTKSTGTSTGFNPAVLSTALAAQLSSLPVATAVSGTGIKFVNGIPTLSSESLGTILTQRGDTIGKHRFFFSFNYQRFAFGSVDGIRMKNFETVNVVNFTTTNSSGATVPLGTSFVASQDRIDFKVDQYTALATFGITDRVDLTLVVPFSTVRLTTSSAGTQYNVDPNGNLVSQFASQSIRLTGEKSGAGDVIVSVKGNLLRAENGISIAVGSDLRIPTGDETNYLGTGAYGIKPFVILSHSGKRLTPNINVGYQWNSSSSLYTDQTTGEHLDLPSSFLYSGGADFRVTKRLTLVGEFIGQFVFNGPRLVNNSVTIPTVGSFVATQGSSGTSNYAIDDAGGGLKLKLWRSLLITASALFKLDDAGLRAKVVPLAGVSYRF
jgi:hypothetical protein